MGTDCLLTGIATLTSHSRALHGYLLVPLMSSDGLHPWQAAEMTLVLSPTGSIGPAVAWANL